MKPRASRAGSIEGEFASAFTKLHAEIAGKQWPSPKWQKDPVGFARHVLRIEPIPEQVTLLNAVRDFPQVAVSSGQKTGKSSGISICAVWWYCSFPNARVIETARTEWQVNEVLYRELARIVRNYERRHGEGALGTLGESCRSGLTSKDQREIRGVTAREAEAFSGISGGDLFNPENDAAILYIVDEASALPLSLYQAMVGNLAGKGGRIVLLSQPTRNQGPFFDAFHSKRDYFFTWTINAETVAARNEREGKVIAGIVNAETIARWKEEWGEESAFYQIRVRGRFVKHDEGKIVSLDRILAATQRYEDEAGGPGRDLELSIKQGRLHIGIDPAGPGVGGDESAFAARRGIHAYTIRTRKGLQEEGHLFVLLEMIRDLSDPREEPPIVKVDSEGAVGAKVYGHLQGYLERCAGLDASRPPFVLVRVRSSEAAMREPIIYGTTRDEIWASLAQWMKTAVLPPDGRRDAELHAPSWLGTVSGKTKATPKEELRKVDNLGRSPDRADALGLAAWEIPELLEQTDAPPKATPTNLEEKPRGPDPYRMVDKSYRS